MADPKLIHSPLSCTVQDDGHELRIEIYRLDETEWSLEVVDEHGTTGTTVWDDLFCTNQEALDEARKAIREEAFKAFT
jgi:hypothetical protein